MELDILKEVFLVAIGVFLDKSWNWLKYMYRSFIVFEYTPPTPIINEATIDIDRFGTTLATTGDNDLFLDASGNLALASGQDAFIELLKSFLYITLQEHKIRGIGCEVGQSIFYTTNKEFHKQCPYLIKAIINHNSLKKCIEQIYSIKKKKRFYLFGEPYIFIAFKVKGRPSTLNVKLKNLEFLAQSAKVKAAH